MPPDSRHAIVDFVHRWSDKTGIAVTCSLLWLGLATSKWHSWKHRYGKVNEHNAWIPRDHWLEAEEKQAILDFPDLFPLEGYRRLTFMMIDQDIAVCSPSSVYRVLKAAERLDRHTPKPSSQGTGFVQPLRPPAHWHVDVSYLNIAGTFSYQCSLLDGCSRFIVSPGLPSKTGWRPGEKRRPAKWKMPIWTGPSLTFPATSPSMNATTAPCASCPWSITALTNAFFMRFSTTTPPTMTSSPSCGVSRPCWSSRRLSWRGITTDGSPLYPQPLAEVFAGVPHQVCEFHVLKELTKAVLRTGAAKRKRWAAATPTLPGGRPSTRRAKRIARQRARLQQKIKDLFEHRHLFVQRYLTPGERRTFQRITRGLPPLRVLRATMDEVYRLFDRRCRAETARAKLAKLRRRVGRFQHLLRVLNKLNSPNLEKALTFLDDKLLPSTSNAVEGGNRRYRKMQKAVYRIRYLFSASKRLYRYTAQVEWMKFLEN